MTKHSHYLVKTQLSEQTHSLSCYQTSNGAVARIASNTEDGYASRVYVVTGAVCAVCTPTVKVN